MPVEELVRANQRLAGTTGQTGGAPALQFVPVLSPTSPGVQGAPPPTPAPAATPAPAPPAGAQR